MIRSSNLDRQHQHTRSLPSLDAKLDQGPLGASVCVEEGEHVVGHVLVVLGEMACSIRPSSAAVMMAAASVSVRRVRFWWNSANDMSSPARMYRRDWDGESSELLYGVSASPWFPVEGRRFTWEMFVRNTVSWGCSGKSCSWNGSSSTLLFSSVIVA